MIVLLPLISLNYFETIAKFILKIASKGIDKPVVDPLKLRVKSGK